MNKMSMSRPWDYYYRRVCEAVGLTGDGRYEPEEVLCEIERLRQADADLKAYVNAGILSASTDRDSEISVNQPNS